MILRALLSGCLGILAMPVLVFLAAIGLAHAAGACGADDGGACYVSAGFLAIYSVLPGFVLFALASLARDLLRRR